MPNGVLLASHGSGTGKTTLTLGILRAFRDQGLIVQPAKSGPDYIDRAFHEAASGLSSFNLDAFAMSDARLQACISGTENLVVEGAMGLFDGAPPDGKGSAADLAKRLKLSVVLILDCSHQSQSIAALLNGFVTHDPEINISGVILNKVGSPRHERILRQALAHSPIPILGAVHRAPALSLPSRHLGLIQAEELNNLETVIATSAKMVSDTIDLNTLLRPFALGNAPKQPKRLPPIAQRIAIARDQAFRFTYPHLLDDWRDQGAELSFFSPLDDQAPDACDAVYLPGGYPELHAGRLANATRFKAALKKTPKVYGECGGYMVMGKHLIDKSGNAHEMLGLLDLITSFEQPKLHLGYRKLTSTSEHLPNACGHEFHFASTIEANGTPLFTAQDAEGSNIGDLGLVNGSYFGSFAHIIDVVS